MRAGEANQTSGDEAITHSTIGLGPATVVDTAVHGSWQLNPDQFVIGNPAWQSSVIAPALRAVANAFGCPPTHGIEANLYKLLLYEPGGIFKPHRDSEKEDGMFGTLIVGTFVSLERVVPSQPNEEEK